jgi:GNAT superfamily N-acetyltransferase
VNAAAAIRALEPDDTERLVALFDRLSPESVYRRFFTLLPHLEGRLLRDLTDIDHDGREAVVAVHDDDLVAVAHYIRSTTDPAVAEVAVVVEDAWQRRGLASRLLHELARLGRERGIASFDANVLADNTPALGLAQAVAPRARFARDGAEVGLRVGLPPVVLTGGASEGPPENTAPAEADPLAGAA